MFLVWKPFCHAVCALVWADEPTPFSVPERLALELLVPLEDEEVPDPAWASLLAQEVTASPTVTAAPIAMLARECFKFFLPKDCRVRPGRGTLRSGRHQRRERRLPDADVDMNGT